VTSLAAWFSAILLAPAPVFDFHSGVNHQSTDPSRAYSRQSVICLILAATTLAVYWPVKHYGFVDYDDSSYFFANPHVLGGLTWPNVKWAFASGQYANWHPLTWLSLMLNASISGSGAGSPHWTNVLLHTANAILVFVLIHRMTAALWRSAAVAALFALHPLHVESVAWVSERKDVLSAFFGLLTLLAYANYALPRSAPCGRQETARHADSRRPIGYSPCAMHQFNYCLALLFFVCGLMSKPVLVTLPFVMLLLDFWPLQRFPAATETSTGEGEDVRTVHPYNALTLPRLFIEKIPFFFLSAASSVVTFIVQQRGGAITALTRISWPLRVENAFISYARYLAKTLWPVNLATPYPPPVEWPPSLVFLSVALFGALCVAAVGSSVKCPFAFTGWFWFAGMLVPVIGIVQVGAAAMADRYAYLPIIGILIIVVWGGVEIYTLCKPHRAAAYVVISILYLACAMRARNQVSVWRDDGALFGNALAVTKNNFVASLDLGFWYSKNGRIQETLKCYDDALRMSPADPGALYDVGNALAKLGDLDDAIRDYRLALEIAPDEPDILDNLGFALAGKKQWAEAVINFQAALKLEPDRVGAHNNLATAFFMEGHYREAAGQFNAARLLSPHDPLILANLGDTNLRLGDTNSAAKCYEEALRMAVNLGGTDLRAGDRNSAAKCCEQALRVAVSLGEIYLRTGDKDNADKCHEQAIRVAVSLGDTYLRTGETNSAAKCYKQALLLQPGNSDIRAKLGALGVHSSD